MVRGGRDDPSPSGWSGRRKSGGCWCGRGDCDLSDGRGSLGLAEWKRQELESQPHNSTTSLGSQPYTREAKREEELKEFVSVVLQDTEDAWFKIFKEQVRGGGYQVPTLVIFDQQVRSACGLADSGTGPFYCPGDDRVYLDLSFGDELKYNFGADGDFALAYVIAHEVGHHVQNLLGTLTDVARKKQRSSEKEKNALQVRVELQADYYAGVWAHYTQKMKNVLDRGDLQEAINAAQAVGDDRLQKRARGYVVPETFTHGTSAQRARWFKKGFESGQLSGGDTFSAKSL